MRYVLFGTCNENAQSFVDLGLSSGTKWKTQNQNGLYTYDDAISRFGNRLPTKEQWDELTIECSWEWTGNVYKLIGPNGNYITLPAEGYRACDGIAVSAGFRGDYWSSTPRDSDCAWTFSFLSDRTNIYVTNRCERRSVRLVQK